MDDTESYLNNILQKRLGSVPGYNCFSKGSTVTRLPKKQQKVQSMPTVFRKKHESVYRPSQILQSQQFKSSASSQQYGTSLKLRKTQSQSQNQRVQYLTISKRISSKQKEVVIAPVVDVSKYRKSLYIPPEQVQSSTVMRKSLSNQMDDSIGKRISTTDSQNTSKHLQRMKSEQLYNDFQIIHEEFQGEESNIDKPHLQKKNIKRESQHLPRQKRRIFGNSIGKR